MALVPSREAPLCATTERLSKLLHLIGTAMQVIVLGFGQSRTKNLKTSQRFYKATSNVSLFSRLMLSHVILFLALPLPRRASVLASW